MDIKSKLKNFIITEFIFENDDNSIQDDELLLEMGIIDSVGVVVLMSFMQEKFGIQFDDKDLVPENFQTINNMKDLIERKQLSESKAYTRS